MQFSILTLSALCLTVFALPLNGSLKYIGAIALGGTAVGVPMAVANKRRREYANAQPLIPVSQTVTEEILPVA